MKKLALGLSAAAIALAAGGLYAATPDTDAAPGARHNRTVAWADAKAKADEKWTRLDVNKDGKLDQADRDAKFAQKFDEIDTNKDSAISRDEFTAHHRDMMDHKGAAPGGAGMAGEGHGMHGMRGHHGRGMRGHGDMMAGGMMGGGKMAAMADTNKDGSVTRAEYDAGVKAHFDKADANKDGKITPEERRAAFKAMRMHGRDGGPMGGAVGTTPPSGK